MNGVSRDQRSANLPGLHMALREVAPYDLRNGLSKELAAWYVEGKRTKDGKYALLTTLACEPDADEARWNELRAVYRGQGKRIPEVSDQRALLDRWLTADRFISTGDNFAVYFGCNTILNGREEAIYKFFYQDLARGVSTAGDSLTKLVSNHTRRVLNWMKPLDVNPYAQGWQQADEFAAIVEAGLPRAMDFSAARDSASLREYICPVEWAHRNPTAFDSRLLPVVRTLRSAMLEATGRGPLAEAYEAVASNHLSHYAEQTAAGGTFSLCVRYDSAEELKAAELLIQPHTRYPYDGDMRDGLIRALPNYDSRRWRLSSQVLRWSWTSGLTAFHMSRCDERTLFIQVKAPLGFQAVWSALVYLCYDLRNIEARANSTKEFPNDDAVQALPRDAICFVQPLRGRWRMVAMGWGDHYAEVWEGEDAILDSVVGAGDTPADFMPAQMTDSLARVRRNGNRLDISRMKL